MIGPDAVRAAPHRSGRRRHLQRTALNGEILPVGGDVALIRADGAFEPDADLVLRSHDGALIHLTDRGRWHAPAEVMARLLRRDAGVDPASYYFRTAVMLETSADDYLWLNKLLAIGVGEPQPGAGIVYGIHSVL